MGIFSRNRNKYKNLRKAGYIIGKHTYVGKLTNLCEPDKIKIGDYCCIANNVFFNPSNHPTNWLSVHPFQYKKKLDARLYGNFPINTNPLIFNEIPKNINILNIFFKKAPKIIY